MGCTIPQYSRAPRSRRGGPTTGPVLAIGDSATVRKIEAFRHSSRLTGVMSLARALGRHLLPQHGVFGTHLKPPHLQI